MSVEEAVERDLAEIRRRDEALANSGLAATAMVMARELDSTTNSATSKSMCAARLQDALERLRELTPPETKGDTVDDITRKRAERLSRRAASADMSGS